MAGKVVETVLLVVGFLLVAFWALAWDGGGLVPREWAERAGLIGTALVLAALLAILWSR
jgi:hypothetical protein